MTIALIVAAGLGERLGAERPKAFVEVAGRPMLQWSIEALGAMDEIEQVVIAMPPGGQTTVPPAVAGAIAGDGIVVVEGGVARSDSVRRALEAAGEAALVLVHDAARPLLTPALARSVVEALERDPSAAAAIAAAPVSDTIKRADQAGAVQETLTRSNLWAVQTPQVFRRAALERALDVPAAVLAEATDDAWLVERSGAKVLVVDVGGENLKVTTRLDLEMAAALLSRRAGGG